MASNFIFNWLCGLLGCTFSGMLTQNERAQPMQVIEMNCSAVETSYCGTNCTCRD